MKEFIIFGKNKSMQDINKIVEEAFSLYMPQDKEEIIKLTEYLVNKNIKTTVEIGTKFGGTFFIWCSLLKGVKISLDIPDGIHGGVSKKDFLKRNVDFLSKFKGVCFIEGNSHHLTTLDKLKKTLKGVSIDFLFIDGDHTYDGVKKDYEMYSTLVNSGGIIVFHDINDTQRHRERNVFVGKFWEEIKNTEKEYFEINSNKDWAGIGVLIKK